MLLHSFINAAHENAPPKCLTQRRTSEVSIGEDTEEGEGVAVHSIVGI